MHEMCARNTVLDADGGHCVSKSDILSMDEITADKIAPGSCNGSSFNDRLFILRNIP
jgi:hypothetical protein